MTRRDWMAATGSALVARIAAAQADVHEEIRTLAARAPLSMQFRGGSAAECRRWQAAFSAKLNQLLGPYQPPARWTATIEQSIELDDHRREALLLRAENCPDLPVYFLVPKNSAGTRRPGILALHGHGPSGYDAIAGIAATPEQQKHIQEIRYDYGLQLVRRGYVVAIPCFTPFGRRLDDAKAYGGDDPCGVTFIRMQALGKLLIAENLRDALWALEALSRRAEADPARLGCAGLSYGGRMAMLTSALSPKIRVAVISGAMNLIQERILNRYSCGAQIIPGLLEYGDTPEIGSLIAPRPALWEVGNRDALMPKPQVEIAIERLHRAYTALDAPANLEIDRFEGGHEWHGAKAYPLLDRVLRAQG